MKKSGAKLPGGSVANAIVQFFAQLNDVFKAVAGLIAVATLAIGSFFATQPEDSENPKDPVNKVVQKIVKNGFHALMPPSSFHGPGVLTTVEDLGDGKIALRLICEMNMSELKSKWIQSQTPPFASEPVAQRATPDAAASALANSILLGMANPKLLTMSDERLQGLQNQYIKGACQQAIVHNLKSGARVCQVQEVVKIPTVESRSLVDSVNVRNEVVPESDDDAWLFIGVRLRSQCITFPGSEDSESPKPGVVTQT